MNRDKTTYCALYEDGSYVEKLTIEELETVPSFPFLIKIDFVQNIGYKLNPITKDGKLTTMLIGSFEIIDMGIEMKGNYFSGMSIKIFDHIKKSVRHYNVQSWSRLDSFKKEIFPLLKRLNELGSWESYELMLEVDDLRIKNDKLTKDNKLLKEKIQQLEKALRNTQPNE